MTYCVYKHTVPNGKVYIGVTCQDIVRRWKNGHGYKTQPYFHKAIEKYGWENITHEVLYDGLSKEEAESKEIELISQYRSNDKRFGYNVYAGGDLGSAGFDVSVETREKLSISHTGERNSFYGKHHSEESINKIRESRIGRDWAYFKGHNHSEETKAKLSALKKEQYRDGKHPMCKRVNQYDLMGNLINTYHSLRYASESNENYSISRLSVACNTGKPYKGYIWGWSE